MGAKCAEVTGVDLSPESIRLANRLKKKAHIEAEFICSDIYEYEKFTTPEFDIVFASYGVLNWLHDLDAWARIVARSLKAGGYLHLIEFHPLYDLQQGDAYFSQKDPDICEDGTYTENCNREKLQMATWPHPLSEVINALIRNGIE